MTMTNNLADRCEAASGADTEALGWCWLEDMIHALCDEDVSDISYSADQMVDAYMAGFAAALRAKEQANAG